MGNIASGHFKPTNNIQEKHNDRTLSPSYLLPEEFRGQNEVNRSSDQARKLKERIIENAKIVYEQTKKKNAPKFKAKSYLWSLVVNIKTNTTMSDLEKLAEHFDLKYGFQCYQIAIHRDEGYIDENNQPHTNHHAHMEFVTLNKENGKNMMRKAHLSSRKFADMQTEIAQILGMDRGKSGTERIEPRKYAQMKEKERKALNSLKQEKTTLESIIQEKDKEIATLNTLNAKLEKTNKDLQRPSLLDTIKDKYIDSTKNKREIERLQKEQEDQKKELQEEINSLKQEKTKLKSVIQAKDKEIATALDTANCHFNLKKETLQEAVERNKSVNEQYFLLGFLDNNPNSTDEYVHELFDKHKDKAIFTKLWNAIKLLFSIIEKLFGDKNAKKDNQDILNAITELQERPTKKQLEDLENCNKEIYYLFEEKEKDLEKAQERVKTLQNSEAELTGELFIKIQEQYKELNTLKQEKDKEIDTLKSDKWWLNLSLKNRNKEIDTLKQEKTTLESKLQDKDKTISELNQFKNSSNLALDLEKSLERVKTLENNENTLKNDLNAKETTINELKKQIQDLEYNYTQERERMKAENKRLQEQGLDKIYTQKDYEALKAEHNEQIEVLKKKLKEQDKYKRQAQNARNKQTQQKRTMKTKQTTTPTPSPTPQQTYTYTKRI